MATHGFESNEDFFEFVKAMSMHLLDIGFNEANGELSSLLDSAQTTSSELFVEIGFACEKIFKRDGGRLPPCLSADLKKCLTVCKSAFC
jgi:hypothetical protein